MQVPIYQVDAFSSRLFGGNPAAVCPLDTWLPDATLQSIAAENNLSETAFFVANGKGYRLRWFTPGCEVDLCGHATLATAYIILNRLAAGKDLVSIETLSGELIVRRDGDLYSLDFPARPPAPCVVPPNLADSLGAVPTEVLAARDLLAVYGSEQQVRALEPNMDAIAKLRYFAVIVTAPGSGDVDFVSRFFAPAKGVAEDPVTGSAHCTLIPYWAKRLGKTKLRARQVSARGGDLWCEFRGDRVTISGAAALYLEGSIRIE
jgi:PhzF family phenazine biosynthesis protein